VDKKKTNQEICNKFEFADISTVIEVRRLEWLGHIRMLKGERRNFWKGSREKETRKRKT
jgi:hypothetical protein